MPRNRMGSLIEEFIAWMRVQQLLRSTRSTIAGCVVGAVRALGG